MRLGVRLVSRVETCLRLGVRVVFRVDTCLRLGVRVVLRVETMGVRGCKGESGLIVGNKLVSMKSLAT